jgi:hypothetical protein
MHGSSMPWVGDNDGGRGSANIRSSPTLVSREKELYRGTKTSLLSGMTRGKGVEVCVSGSINLFVSAQSGNIVGLKED